MNVLKEKYLVVNSKKYGFLYSLLPLILTPMVGSVSMSANASQSYNLAGLIIVSQIKHIFQSDMSRSRDRSLASLSFN
jgi:hypothetical protein